MTTTTPVRRISVAVSLLLTAAVLATTPAPTSAAAPPPSSPENLSVTDEGPTPMFTWDPVGQAREYTIEADDDPGFSSTLFSVDTDNVSYVHTKRLPAGEVYWRVRAESSDGESSWSTAQLDAGANRAPVPLAPLNDTAVTPPVDPPVLSWEVVPGAVSYRVEVASNDTFTSPASYSTKSTSFVVPTPQGVGVYHWRVRADFGSGLLTPWSTNASYEVVPLPLIDGDDVTSPPTDVAVQDVVLDWAPVRGAQRYQLQVATDRDFNEIIDSQTTIYSTRYSPRTTYPNNDYFWRVRAVNSAGQPTDWATAPLEFQRRWPDRPSLLHPANGTSTPAGDAFYFEWTPVQHAKRYRLEVGNDPNFSPGSFDRCYTASTTYAAGYLTSDDCMPGGQGSVHYWRVLAVEPSTGPDVPSIYSPIQSFIYDSGPVVKTSPAAGATVDVPTLHWEAQREVERYRVTVRDASSSVIETATTYALSWTPRERLSPEAGPFTWTVVAEDENGSLSPNYGWRSFNVTGDTTDDPQVNPLSPTSPAAATRFPSLSWEPYPGADHYRLEVGVQGTGYNLDPATTALLSRTYQYPAVTDESDYFLNPATYRWRVRPYDGSGAPLDAAGPYGTFTIADLPAVSGERIALTGGATGTASTSCDKQLGAVVTDEQICLGVPSTPVLRWDPVPGASSYMVYLAEDRDLTQLVYGDSATNRNIPRTSNTMWTPHWDHDPEALPDNQSGRAYFWFIRPCKAPGRCGPDPLNTDDAATHAFRKRSPSIEQLQPADGESVANQVTFTWRDYLETNEEVAFPTGVEGAPTSHLTADRYRIEVFTSRTTSSPIDSQLVDQTTYTPFNKTYPEGDLWWRVQAVDPAGNGLGWSDLRVLHHNSPYQNLNPNESLATGNQGPLDTGISPSHNEHVEGDVALRWTARAFDSRWNIEIYSNDDTTGSPANLVYRGTVSQAAFTWTDQIPASASAYRWRIQRRDATGEPGPWSDWGRFFVDRSDIEPLQPGPGIQPASTTSFSWSPVQRAASYRLEVVGTNGGRSFNQTTVASRWSPTSTLRTGSYSWRVRAFDASGDEIAASQAQAFTVDATAPEVDAYAPRSMAKRKANFTVRFSEPVGNVSSRSMKLRVQGRNTPVKARVKLSADGTKATLNPTGKLKRGKTYTCTVTAAVRDAAGNQLEAFTWSVKAR